MKSPFPGMDPWLEQPSLWPDLHGTLITVFRRALVPQVLGRYTAGIEFRTTRVRADDPAFRFAIPDVLVVREAAPAYKSSRGISNPTAVVTMAEWAEFREPLLVIRDRSNREIVTWVELLSPTNKTAGSSGRTKYLSKRRNVMRTKAHLVEIDLLRAGERLPFVEPLPEGNYFAHISRAERRPSTETWAAMLADTLPVLPIPLRSPDADARLDLQEALAVAYAEARYDTRVDYGQPTEPPLTPAQARWAKQRVAKGKRGTNGRR